MMDVAQVIAQRSECPRRQVGCVITSEDGRILATGFNGLAPGMSPCIDNACGGEGLPSGEGLDICLASHAEISALVSLRDPTGAYNIHVTTAPCVSCVKALLLTKIKRLYFLHDYAASGLDLWEENLRETYKLNIN